MKKSSKKGFTLVELLAVIAVLAVILLIVIPLVLGVIEDARKDAFRNSTLNIFGAIELAHSEKGHTSGNIKDLNMNNGNQFMTGNWEYEEDGDITLNQVCNGEFKIESLKNVTGELNIKKDDGTCSFNIEINGNNPDTISCKATGTYHDAGAKYGKENLISSDEIDLRYAGNYELNYYRDPAHAVRSVQITNKNIPTLILNKTKVVISTINTTFDPMDYVTEATDSCEGNIKKYLNDSDLTNGRIISNVVFGVPDIYQVQYEVVNKGGQKKIAILEVEIKENELIVNGNNPDTVSCHATNKYQDQGATYNFDSSIVVYAAPLSLKNAGTSRISYQYDLNGILITTTRTVNITNENVPTITLSKESETIYRGDTFDPDTYVISVIDPCEGNIKSKLTSTTNLNTDVAGTYQVIYKVSNLGNKEVEKTLNVTVLDLPTPSIAVPTVDGTNGWYKTNQNISVNYNNTILNSYEYAISIDGGTTYENYINKSTTTFLLNKNSSNIKIKIRGKRGNKYTNIIESGILKMDTIAPNCTSSGGSTVWGKSRTIIGTCSDGPSGCINNSITKSYTTNTNISNASPGVVIDKAGNRTTCPSNQIVKVDVTKPTISGLTNLTINKGTSANLTSGVTTSDTGGSGVKGSYSYQPTTTTQLPVGTSYITYRVEDNAGNFYEARRTITVNNPAPPPASQYVFQSLYTTTTTGSVPKDGWYRFYVIGKGGNGGAGGKNCKRYYDDYFDGNENPMFGGAAGSTGAVSIHQVYLTTGTTFSVQITGSATKLVVAGKTIIANNGRNGATASRTNTSGPLASGGNVANYTGAVGLGSSNIKTTRRSGPGQGIRCSGSFEGSRYSITGGQGGNAQTISGIKYFSTSVATGGAGASTTSFTFPDSTSSRNKRRSDACGDGLEYGSNGGNARSVTYGSTPILGQAGAGGGGCIIDTKDATIINPSGGNGGTGGIGGVVVEKTN